MFKLLFQRTWQLWLALSNLTSILLLPHRSIVLDISAKQSRETWVTAEGCWMWKVHQWQTPLSFHCSVSCYWKKNRPLSLSLSLSLSHDKVVKSMMKRRGKVREMKNYWFPFWDTDTTCGSLKQPKLLLTAVWPTERSQQLDSIRGFLKGGRPNPHCLNILYMEQSISLSLTAPCRRKYVTKNVVLH